MLFVVPVHTVRVGDVLAEGLVIAVEPIENDERGDTLLHFPLGVSHAKKSDRTCRFTRVTGRELEKMLRVMQHDSEFTGRVVT